MHASKRQAVTTAAVFLAALISAGILSFPNDRAVATEVVDATPAVDGAQPRMKHPAKGYVMFNVYFEKHHTDDEMNMDALNSIKLAAAEAKKGHFALVVTCHGEDAFDDGGSLTPTDLAEGRFQTVRQDLIDLGIAETDILADWGDPKLTAAAAKRAGPMRSDAPTCNVETAVPADRNSPAGNMRKH